MSDKIIKQVYDELEIDEKEKIVMDFIRLVKQKTGCKDYKILLKKITDILYYNKDPFVRKGENIINLTQEGLGNN